MPFVEWRHNRTRLLLPIGLLQPSTGDHPWRIEQVDGLLDTGATATGVRADIVARLDLKQKGRRRVFTANGDIMADEYLVRIGFVCGDLDAPDFTAARHLPFVIDQELPCFELKEDFSYSVLIGMDVIGRCDLALRRDGSARLTIPD